MGDAVEVASGIARHVDIAAGVGGDAVSEVRLGCAELLDPLLIPVIVIFDYKYIIATVIGEDIEPTLGKARQVDVAAGVGGDAVSEVRLGCAELLDPQLVPGTVIFDYEYISSTAARINVKVAIGIARYVDIAAGISGNAAGDIACQRAELLGPLLDPGVVVFDHEYILATDVVVAVETPIGIACHVDIAAGIGGNAGGDIVHRSAELPGPLFYPRAVVFNYEQIRATARGLAVEFAISIARQVDIAAGIGGDAVGDIIRRRTELLSAYPRWGGTATIIATATARNE